MRPIDADALLSMFCEFYTNYERANRLVFSACEIKQMFADMLNETPTIEQPKWIPVTDSLPETIVCSAGTAYSEAVLVWTSGRKAMIAVWDGIDFLCDADY